MTQMPNWMINRNGRDKKMRSSGGIESLLQSIARFFFGGFENSQQIGYHRRGKLPLLDQVAIPQKPDQFSIFKS